jgi:hypothetical protein
MIIVRSSENKSGLNTIGTTAGDDGIINNVSWIVNDLVFCNNSYFSKHLKVYGNVTFAYYPDLDFDAMYKFATEHGDAEFGFSDGASFCTKFANDVIRAGGGEMEPVIDAINSHKVKLGAWLIMYKNNDEKLKELIEENPWIPVPGNYVKDIKNRFPNVNKE